MQDRLTPPEHSDDIVRHLPGAEHVLVADAGHVIMVEHPDLLNEQLLALAQRATRAGIDPAGKRRPSRGKVRRTLTDIGSVRRAKAARRRVDAHETGQGAR